MNIPATRGLLQRLNTKSNAAWKRSVRIADTHFHEHNHWEGDPARRFNAQRRRRDKHHHRTMCHAENRISRIDDRIFALNLQETFWPGLKEASERYAAENRLPL